MSLLPWEEWLYHNEERKEEVNALHREAVSLIGQVQAGVDALNSLLPPSRKLVVCLTALNVAAHAVQMDDYKYSDFLVEVDAVEPDPQGYLSLEIGGFLTETVGSLLIIKAYLGGLMRFDKFLGRFEGTAEEVERNLPDEIEMTEIRSDLGIEVEGEVDTSTEVSAETVGEGVEEAAAEAVLEGASASGLAATGIGIFAAVGVDAIFGAINGAKERDELNGQINDLEKAIRKTKKYIEKIEWKCHRSGERIGMMAGAIKHCANLLKTIDQFDNGIGNGVHYIILPRLPVSPPGYGFGEPMVTIVAPYEIGEGHRGGTTADERLFLDAPMALTGFHPLTDLADALIVHYATYIEVRTAFVAAKTKKPDVSLDAFVTAYTMTHNMDEVTVRKCLEVMKGISQIIADAPKS